MRNTVRLALSAACLALGAANAATAASPPAWVVDKAHSTLGFDSAYSGAKFNGSFNTWSANITFDPANLAASKASVTIDLASTKTGDPDRDDTLPAPDWFNTARFPKATFTTTAIKALGAGRYRASGVISLKGVNQPATLTFTLKITGKQAVMVGQAVVDRTQWKIGQGQFTAETPVPHAVTVKVNLTANKAG